MFALHPILVAAAMLVNAWTMLRFWQDKRRAITEEPRIPESSLLGLPVFGGSPGTLLARKLFRHKMRKEPISIQLFVIVPLQLGAVIGLTVTSV